MRIVLVLALFALAACGADGEPITPEKKKTAPGVSMSITGKAEIGITS